MNELSLQTQEKTVEEKRLSLPNLDLHTKVTVKDGYVENFEEDLEKPLIGQTLEDIAEDLKMLKDLGLNVDTQEWESRDGEDFAGHIIISKEELNSAIQRGLLKFKVNVGDIEIEQTV